MEWGRERNGEENDDLEELFNEREEALASLHASPIISLASLGPFSPLTSSLRYPFFAPPIIKRQEPAVG